MTKDEVKKLRMNSPESLQFLNNATKFYNLMMMYRCAIREIQTNGFKSRSTASPCTDTE